MERVTSILPPKQASPAVRKLAQKQATKTQELDYESSCSMHSMRSFHSAHSLFSHGIKLSSLYRYSARPWFSVERQHLCSVAFQVRYSLGAKKYKKSTKTPKKVHHRFVYEKIYRTLATYVEVNV